MSKTSEEILQEVMTSEGRVIVDFWAEWCVPCKVLGPVLEDVSKETGTPLIKIRTEEHPEIASQFMVTFIPAVFIMEGGKVLDSFVGVLPKDQIISKLN